jgi:hypothetical protein
MPPLEALVPLPLHRVKVRGLLAELGYGADDIARLAEEGVVALEGSEGRDPRGEQWPRGSPTRTSAFAGSRSA